VGLEKYVRLLKKLMGDSLYLVTFVNIISSLLALIRGLDDTSQKQDGISTTASRDDEASLE
jgi:hypothetical protein